MTPAGSSTLGWSVLKLRKRNERSLEAGAQRLAVRSRNLLKIYKDARSSLIVRSLTWSDPTVRCLIQNYRVYHPGGPWLRIVNRQQQAYTQDGGIITFLRIPGELMRAKYFSENFSSITELSYRPTPVITFIPTLPFPNAALGLCTPIAPAPAIHARSSLSSSIRLSFQADPPEGYISLPNLLAEPHSKNGLNRGSFSVLIVMHLRNALSSSLAVGGLSNMPDMKRTKSGFMTSREAQMMATLTSTVDHITA